MRITVQLLPLLLLFLVIPLSVVHQLSVLEAVLITAGLLVLRTFLVLYGSGKRISDKRVILETISISHYVEKLRWCLDYLGIDYIEEENVGVLGFFLLGRSVPQLKVPEKRVTIGNSSNILRYLYGENCLDDKLSPFLKPTPLSLSLEKKFDQLGEDLRRFAYFSVFSNLPSSAPFLNQAWGMHQANIPQWQKLLLKLLSPLFVKLLIKRLKVNAEDSKKSIENAYKTIDEVESLLSDGRKFLLDTSQPTYIDFHFCSIIAVITKPNNYGGKIFAKEEAMELPGAWEKEAEKIRERVAGKFVHQIYETLGFRGGKPPLILVARFPRTNVADYVR